MDLTLKAFLDETKTTKTVYALVFPETTAVINDLLDSRASYHDMYQEAWTQKQDAMHKEFFTTWKLWSKDHVSLPKDFIYDYPTLGASEAIKDALFNEVFKAHAAQKQPILLYLEGEYEGYVAMAKSANILVQQITNIDTLPHLPANSQPIFFISQPSAIAGMVISNLDQMLATLANAYPNIHIYIDLTYIGSIKPAAKLVDLTPECIRGICFSLSKPYGVYYHRIGGLITRDPVPSLFGNQWFKNLFSLKLGTALMRRYHSTSLPTFYAPAQAKALKELQEKTQLPWEASDVLLLAHAPSKCLTGHYSYFNRSTQGRICLTPRIYEHIYNLPTTVTPRYTEKLT
jgi:hypothetical protein